MVHGKEQPVFITSKFLNPCTPKKIQVFGYIEEEVPNSAANRSGTSSPKQAKSAGQSNVFASNPYSHAYNQCSVHLDLVHNIIPLS